MEMKEKKADLELLLNSLIKRGWKPFREKSKSVEYLFEGNQFYFKNIPGELVGAFYSTTRELVSKESNLWQFVCEKDLINEEHQFFAEYEYNEWSYKKKTANPSRDFYLANEYQYRLIESSLKDESELEDFLLQNIKID